MLQIGIIKEGKVPSDKRVALTPVQCKHIQENYPVRFVVQSSTIRTYSDSEYTNAGIEVQENLLECHYLLGVKEVPVEMLIPEKTYFFFSHTIKKQPYNQKLLRAVLDKKIKLVDWETLVDERGNRVIAFGRFAGIVGAYNSILTYGKKHNLFHLKPAHQCFDLSELKKQFSKVKLPAIKIALTGGGRVSNGAMEILDGIKIRKVSVDEFLNTNFDVPVYCQIHSSDYNKKEDGTFDKNEFYKNPKVYHSDFLKFAKITDLLISGAYWNPEAPRLFELNEISKPEFNISVIGDITMDINGSIPTTMKAATIENPCYDINKTTLNIEESFSSKNNLTMMAVDNLPCELPRDASESFGEQFIHNVLLPLINPSESDIISKATITENGRLTPQFSYLKEYAEGGNAMV